MHLQVLKYGKAILEKDVKAVTLPGVDGEITPMDGHARMVSVLKKGKMHFIRSEQEGEEREYYDIDGVIAEVTHTSVVLFVRDAVKEGETGDLPAGRQGQSEAREKGNSDGKHIL